MVALLTSVASYRKKKSDARKKCSETLTLQTHLEAQTKTHFLFSSLNPACERNRGSGPPSHRGTEKISILLLFLMICALVSSWHDLSATSSDCSQKMASKQSSVHNGISIPLTSRKNSSRAPPLPPTYFLTSGLASFSTDPTEPRSTFTFTLSAI